MLKRFFLSERNIMVAILLNGVVITLMYFPAYRDNKLLEWLDIGFILFFIAEALVKITVMKPKGYFSHGWNRFDFFIVVGSLPTLLIHLAPIPNTSLLLLLRLFRLVRLLRFIRFIPHMSKLLTGLARAMRASVFVILALAFMNFMLAIFTCHFYGEAVPEYFGDPIISAYSIFQLFTVEGWDGISDAVASHTDHPALVYVAKLYIGLIVLLGGIFGMSLANAVFVDEMTMDNNQDLENKIDELKTELADLKQMIGESMARRKEN